jgi:hypothetical protein
MSGQVGPRQGWRRLLLATLLAPIALLPAISLWYLGLAVVARGLHRSPADALAGAVVSGFVLGGFGLVVALPMTVTYLLPVALLLQRFGRAHVLAVTSAGALAGAASGIPEGTYAVAFYAYCGAVVALAFWAIGQPRSTRPPGSAS